MRIAAIVCNVLVFAITGAIVLTEGMPRELRYLVLTLLMLLIPLFSAIVLIRKRRVPQGTCRADRLPAMTLTHRAAVLCNIVLFGVSCWAAVAQYPYIEGNSVIPFGVLAVCTPIVSVVAFLGGRRSAMPQERQSTARSGLGHDA